MLFDAFYRDGSELVRVAVVGVSAYVALVVMLRISGKRTLSKLNAFDLIVTVALGSTLATILISRDVTLSQGLTALAVLIGLQFAVTWTAVRWPGFERLVKSEPALLARDGEMLPAAMRRERVADDEVVAAIRSSGGREVADAEAVFLETDGSLTAVLKPR